MAPMLETAPTTPASPVLAAVAVPVAFAAAVPVATLVVLVAIWCSDGHILTLQTHDAAVTCGEMQLTSAAAAYKCHWANLASAGCTAATTVGAAAESIKTLNPTDVAECP
jgi:hypothetical protein